MNHQQDPTTKEQENREYRRFVWGNSLKGILWIAAILIAYVLIESYIPLHWKELLGEYTDKPLLMISIFFLSETFSSLIPLEIFLIWASLDGLNVYIKYVVLFTVLSCIGGIIAYVLGILAQSSVLLRRISENASFKKYSVLYQKWGGVMIIIAAMTPVPYSIICFLSGTFNFPRNKFLLYSTTRILRVILSAWLVWSLPE